MSRCPPPPPKFPPCSSSASRPSYGLGCYMLRGDPPSNLDRPSVVQRAEPTRGRCMPKGGESTAPKLVSGWSRSWRNGWMIDGSHVLSAYSNASKRPGPLTTAHLSVSRIDSLRDQLESWSCLASNQLSFVPATYWTKQVDARRLGLSQANRAKPRAHRVSSFRRSGASIANFGQGAYAVQPPAKGT